MNTSKSRVLFPSPGKQIPRCAPVPFRTILKCRNNPNQPYLDDGKSPQKSVSTSRVSALNNSMSDFQLNPSFQAKKTKDKEDLQQALTMSYGQNSSKLQIKKKQDEALNTSKQISSSKILNGHSICQPIIKSQREDQLSTEQLQKRIQNLLTGKVQKYKNHTKGIGLTDWDYLKKDNLYTELEEIKRLFQSRKQTEQSISQISDRVQVLEKMIAGQAIEAQLIKSRYLGFKSQRTNLASFQTKKKDYITSFNLTPQFPSQTISPGHHMMASMGSFTSTNREAYSKPSKDSYEVSRHKHPNYSPNRQVLPKSTYSTQYVKYEPILTLNSKYVTSASLPSNTSLAVKTSTYQVEFKQRKNNIKPIDHRELDCHRDKFKNPQISFMNSCKKEMFDASKHLKKSVNAKIETKITGSKQIKLLNQTSCREIYKSQNKRNYHGYFGKQSNEIQWVRGVPKNTFLEELKGQLKKTYLRG